jgi:hypothetical protein
VFYTWGEPKFALIVVASAAFDWTVAFPRYRSDYLHIDLEETSRLQAVPSITFVGGSFTRGMIAFLESARTANVTFLYYYVLTREEWPRAGAPVVHPVGPNHDFAAEFLSSDVVILEMNVEAMGGKHIRSFLDDAPGLLLARPTPCREYSR